MSGQLRRICETCSRTASAPSARSFADQLWKNDVVGASGQMSIAAAIYPDLKYHPTKTLIPLAMMGSFPLIMVVGPDNLSGNVKELIEWAKQHPDKANYPSTSPALAGGRGPGAPAGGEET